MATTTGFVIDGDTITARTSTFQDGDRAFYTISADDYAGGTVLVQPARFGMHPTHGVLVTFGGYGGQVDFGDFGVSGSVLCTGPDMRPGPALAHGSRQYPIGQVRAADPAMADYISDVVAAIAAHYTDTYRGRGHR